MVGERRQCKAVKLLTTKLLMLGDCIFDRPIARIRYAQVGMPPSSDYGKKWSAESGLLFGRQLGDLIDIPTPRSAAGAHLSMPRTGNSVAANGGTPNSGR